MGTMPCPNCKQPVFELIMVSWRSESGLSSRPFCKKCAVAQGLYCQEHNLGLEDPEDGSAALCPHCLRRTIHHYLPWASEYARAVRRNLPRPEYDRIRQRCLDSGRQGKLSYKMLCLVVEAAVRNSIPVRDMLLLVCNSHTAKPLLGKSA